MSYRKQPCIRGRLIAVKSGVYKKRREMSFVVMSMMLLVAVAPAYGQALPNQNSLPFEVLGNGADTCGDLLQGTSAMDIDIDWILGYISGVNSRAPQGQRSIGTSYSDPASVEVWLQNYCEAHPFAVMALVAEALRTQFASQEGVR